LDQHERSLACFPGRRGKPGDWLPDGHLLELGRMNAVWASLASMMVIAMSKLAEWRAPSFRAYTLSDAVTCMQLMDSVLFNRLENPDRYHAKGAKTVGDIIRALGQFAGFQNCPNCDPQVANRIQADLNIANAKNDRRSADFVAFVNAAIVVATNDSVSEPSPGTLTSWRTAGSGSPGSGFSMYTTLLGESILCCLMYAFWTSLPKE
jgi:hypothetical protein